MTQKTFVLLVFKRAVILLYRENNKMKKKTVSFVFTLGLISSAVKGF